MLDGDLLNMAGRQLLVSWMFLGMDWNSRTHPLGVWRTCLVVVQGGNLGYLASRPLDAFVTMTPKAMEPISWAKTSQCPPRGLSLVGLCSGETGAGAEGGPSVQSAVLGMVTVLLSFNVAVRCGG